MKLVFDLIKCGEEAPNKMNYHFNKEGGIIGRSEDSTWKLLDQHNYISNKHLVIEYKDEVYFIRDESTNGTYLKFPYKRLPKGTNLKINSTDIFVLGDHEIQARFVEDDFSADIVDSFISTPLEETKTMNEKNIIPDDDFLNDDFDNLESNEIDIMDIIDDSKTNDIENTVVHEEANIEELENEIEDQHISIPVYGKEKAEEKIVITDKSLEQCIHTLEKKLGINITSLDSEDRDTLMEELGDIVLNTLDGLKHSLELNEKIKEDLKVLKVNENSTSLNPIILGQSASQLLQNKETSGLLGISKVSDGIKQSFRELDYHNIALHSSSKNIIKISASKFSPKTLEYRFESKADTLKSLLPRPLIMWNAYKEFFKKIDEDSDYGANLIRDDFSKEYKNVAYSIKLAANQPK